jgi:geranylgeranyl pyrophosphate synthase
MLATTATFFELVRDRLSQVEARMRAGSGKHHPNTDAAIEHLLASGGKRIRPTLALLAGEMLGAETERTVTLAASIEMLHTATLVHDDLIDGSLLRRGLPTLNAQWTPGATVLTGDYIFARAAQLAAQTGSLRLMELFAQTLMTIVNGEITQLFRSRRGDLRQSYYQSIYAKTASLFELAGEAAALLGTSAEDSIRPMKDFGYQVGMAFQIVDDVLDFAGNQEQVGKPLASDLRQGLVTLPTVHYLEMHPEDPDLVRLLEDAHLDSQALDRLIASIRSSGAIERSLEEAGRYAAAAEADLATMPDCRETEGLRQLARYTVQRST